MSAISKQQASSAEANADERPLVITNYDALGRSQCVEQERGSGRADASAGDEAEPEANDEGLEEAVEDEQQYLRQRLREELGREPTEQEIDEWQRRHTEGY